MGGIAGQDYRQNMNIASVTALREPNAEPVWSPGLSRSGESSPASDPLSQVALDYQRIEKAIRYLQANYLEQPDLASVACAVHLSEYHFQRLFSRWAGISPKRFLQFLTIEHAKEQLAASKALLEATLDSGLSSPGRLHDLFVTAEAMTPGQFKRCGAGLQIDYGFHPTPFGHCLLGVTKRGVCWLSFLEHGNQAGALREMKSHWRGAVLKRDDKTTAPVVARIFCRMTANGDRPLNVLLLGTNFQIKVWQALLRIPEGAAASYEAVGAMLGAGSRARAVGTAVGRNPIAYLIPCHRVLRKTGALGGYRWGEARKQAIRVWEAARTAA